MPSKDVNFYFKSPTVIGAPRNWYYFRRRACGGAADIQAISSGAPWWKSITPRCRFAAPIPAAALSAILLTTWRAIRPARFARGNNFQTNVTVLTLEASMKSAKLAKAGP
jgi:hypothetical protein